MIISHTSAEHPQRVEDQPQRAPSAGDRPLRFCMVTTYYPPYHFGGDATFVRALSRALVDAGHHVEVVHCEDAFRLRGHEPVQDENVPDGVTVHRVRSRFKRLSPIATQQFGIPGFKTTQIREVLNGPFDVVNFHNISLVGGPGILKLSRATVTLYTVHERGAVGDERHNEFSGRHAVVSGVRTQ